MHISKNQRGVSFGKKYKYNWSALDSSKKILKITSSNEQNNDSFIDDIVIAVSSNEKYIAVYKNNSNVIRIKQINS